MLVSTQPRRPRSIQSLEQATLSVLRMQEEEVCDAELLHRRGWQKLEEGRHLEALADLCLAIERDPECAEAYNKRGILRQILGLDLEDDFEMADALQISRNDATAHEQMRSTRKWQPAGWKGR